MALSKICILIVYSAIVNCQSLPQFQNIGESHRNNSFIYYERIHEGGAALECVTNMSINCCHDTNVSNWRDERGELVQEGADDGTCLYVTRGDGEISLNRRNSDCIPPTSGLWRCDIPDSSGEIQSLYIYISNDTSFGRLSESVNVSFILHTELRASVPEFTISCHTHGGPATTVGWTVDGVKVKESDIDHETSRVILDTSHNSVYDNRLRVRGRRAGTYYCRIIGHFIDTTILARSFQTITVAGEPTSLLAVISGSTCTHVNMAVSWESPGGDVSGYMIYYQTEGGPVISDKVSGGERETNSLDGLQRGVTYNISILALSQHLPSPLVGPVSVNTSNSDHDADCDLNLQTTSHITPSPSSVSPTLKSTSTTSGGQTSTLSTTEETTTTSSTEDTEQHTSPTSTTTILQSTDSGEPSVNTETSKEINMNILTTSSTLIPQHSKDITAATETHKGSTRTTTRRGGTSSEGFNVFMNNSTSSREMEPSCTDNSAVIAGGVGGVMTLIIVSQSVIILILLLRQKKATKSQESPCSGEKMETSGNEAYGMVEPQYEVVGL